MSLKNTWFSIEDWAEANGMTLEDALEEGISQDDNDVIQLPEDYNWKPSVPADQYYETVDVELYITSENASDVTEVVDFMLDKNSDFRQFYWEQFFNIQYDEEITKFNLGKLAYFMYIISIKDRELEFGRELSILFPKPVITVASSNIDIDYWAEYSFVNGDLVFSEQAKFSEKEPDIYREYMEDKASS